MINILNASFFFSLIVLGINKARENESFPQKLQSRRCHQFGRLPGNSLCNIRKFFRFLELRKKNFVTRIQLS